MASRLVNKRRLKRVILNFMVAVISLALTILGLIAGLLPYSTLGRMVMSGQRPGTYWIMVVALLLISLIFFALGLWALKRYRSNVPAY